MWQLGRNKRSKLLLRHWELTFVNSVTRSGYFVFDQLVEKVLHIVAQKINKFGIFRDILKKVLVTLPSRCCCFSRFDVKCVFFRDQNIMASEALLMT